MTAKRSFSLRYKFFLAQAATLLAVLVAFLGFVGQRVYEDKKLYIRDLTNSLLQAATNGFKLQMSRRLDRLQQLAPKVIFSADGTTANLAPMGEGLDKPLADELFQLTFYFEENGQLRQAGQFINPEPTQRKKLSDATLKAMSALKPPVFAAASDTVSLANRTAAGPNPVAVLSVAIRLRYGDRPAVIVADLDATFLMRELAQNELASIFIVRKDGALVAHPDARVLVRYNARPFPYPLVSRFRDVASQAENHELEFEETSYLASFGAAGLPGMFMVVQLPMSELWAALTNLAEKTILVGLVIGYVALVFSMVFARKLTGNLATLKKAADRVGTGDFGFKVKIQSNDEVASVARSFNDMTSRIRELLEESMVKARMEDELNTASLIQSTLLAQKTLAIPDCDYAFHYASASECSGDFWDVFVHDHRVTLAVADATGHGVSAAIVTAVAKSCLATMNYIFNDHVLAPENYLVQLNNVIHQACQGKLLMTMCLVQIDLRDGSIRVANAGHEFPLCFRHGTSDHDHPARAVEELVARGERLGFAPDIEYESQQFTLRPGDSLLLYTDGIVENQNNDGKPWGERQLRKAFGEAALQTSRTENAASVIRDTLVIRHRDFVGGEAPKDDVTFVTFRWGQSANADTVGVDAVPAPVETPAAEEAPIELSLTGNVSDDDDGAAAA